MLDEARLLVERRVPPAVAARCEEIYAAGGMGPPPPGAMPDVLPPTLRALPNAGLLGARLGIQPDRCLTSLRRAVIRISCFVSTFPLSKVYV